MSTTAIKVAPHQQVLGDAPPNGSQTAAPKRLRLPTHLDLPITDEEAASGKFPTFEEIMKEWPTHLDLPFKDNRMHNFLEHPQSMLLTEAIWPILEQRHPDGQFIVGQDSAIYWRYTDPPQKGAVSPDWYYVPNVPPLLNGETRRSYVLWNEFVSPLIVIEFISDTLGNEYDRTPQKGKFWVYEQAVHVHYYVIFTPVPAKLEVFSLVGSEYQLVEPNERGHYPIPELGVELGLWQGVYRNMQLDWMRWWNDDGELLLTGEELVAREAQRAEHEAQRAERLAAKLRALGIDPNEDESA
jgi:Uma2 family endonuclease